MATVSFPGREEMDFVHEGMLFPAIVDGAAIQCFISMEALMCYGLRDHGQLLSVFIANRSSIESLAQTMIQSKKVRHAKLSIMLADVR